MPEDNQMQKGLVSVVIPNYNYAHFLRETLDSVLAQTYSDIEIIVVDDGSSDTSRQVLEGYRERIKTIFQQNQGVSAARNNGVSASRGEFISFLDADDAWLPEKIEKQVGMFSIDRDLGLVHVGVIEIDQHGRELLERLDGLEGEAADDLLMLKRECVLGGGSGAMVPRRVFEEVGGFDLRLSTSADWDLFYRIAVHHAVGFVPELLLRYRVHGSNMHSNVAVMERDMSLGFEKAFGDTQTTFGRKCYGNLYKTLAGSYFRAGNYAGFARTMVQSLRYDWRGITYFISFPLRKLKARSN